MSSPSVDLDAAVRAIVGNHENPPPEAAQPAAHYLRTSNDHVKTLTDLTRACDVFATISPTAREGHLTRSRGMVLVNLIETFERYLKEAAAACIDLLARHVLDDRFNKFPLSGGVLAAHFAAGTVGRALCEALVPTDTAKVNDRFRALLADPFEDGKFALFPTGKKDPDRRRFETLKIVWQLRHTVVHNVGIITKSDAIKFQLRMSTAVPSPVLLTPTRDDVRHLKQFLDDTVELAGGRIAGRLGEILTVLHAGNSSLFDPRATADDAARAFGRAVTVAGHAGDPSPPAKLH